MDPRGRVTEFVAPGSGGLWAPLGMRVDPKRRVLWVASAAVPQTSGYKPADSLRSGLFRFDLATGKPTGSFPVTEDGKPHALGDVLIGSTGDVYTTDSRGPAIYRVRAGADPSSDSSNRRCCCRRRGSRSTRTSARCTSPTTRGAFSG